MTTASPATTAPADRIASPLVPVAHGTLPAGARPGTVHLTVTDLDRALAFYEGVLGLPLTRREGATAVLGAGGEELLALVEEPEARRAGRHAGLFHVALLYPSRLELARVALRLSASGTPVDGASDHGTHEALYLPDPDGNGVELAADTPPAGWPSYAEEFARSGPRPLDAASLFALVEGERPTNGPREGIRIGHVHLHVADVEAAERFYREVVGFDTMAQIGTAAFVSAGGYHHHLAFNVWRGRGVPPQPAGTVGLRHWTLVVPGAADLAALRGRIGTAVAAGAPVDSVEADGGGVLLRDPSGNALLVVAAS